MTERVPLFQTVFQSSIGDGGTVRSLSLRGLKALRELPQILTVRENLRIRACPHIRELPDNLHVPGNFNLTHYNTWTALPRNLRVGGDLRIEYCRKLEDVGAGLTVGRRLISCHCPELSLASFPQDTVVEGEWYCWGRQLDRPAAQAAAYQAAPEPDLSP